MTEPVLLDLFCCAGGAAKGYQRAGFRVIGVDIEPRPNYCGDEFIQADVLDFLTSVSGSKLAASVDLIHRSDPCQAGSALVIGTHKGKGVVDQHTQFIPLVNPLMPPGVPYLIEQPVGNAPIRRDLRLCMDMFPIDPPRVFRHRWFELNGFTVPEPFHQPHTKSWKGVPASMRRVRGWRDGWYSEGSYIAAYGHGGGKGEIAEMQHALGINWTSERKELTEAIPPAFTEYIGRHFLQSR
jgi:hypothetical protein